MKDKKIFFIKLLATGFGSGYSPFASGTAGTLMAVPLYLVLLWGCRYLLFPLIIYIFLVIILTISGIWICTQSEIIFQKKDSGYIVLDEIIGFFISMIGLKPDWVLIGIGFFLFRLFDVWKPFGIRRLQNLHGGLGVMIDDVACGILTCGILHGLRLFGGV